MDDPDQSRLQRRIERLCEIRDNYEDTSPEEMKAAGSMAGLLVSVVAFLLLAGIGLIEPNRIVGIVMFVAGLVGGALVGRRTMPRTTTAKALSGIWMIVMLIGGAAMVVFEFLMLGALFSLFSCS